MNEHTLSNLEQIFSDILNELITAKKKFNDFHSYHEGYAVIKEEYEELWDEIKKKKPEKEFLYEEAMQLATMAIRFIIDMELLDDEE